MKKIIFFTILFLLLLTKVYANEYHLEVEHVYNTYAYFYDNNQQKNRYLYSERYSLDNTTVYCLELGKKITNRYYTPSSSLDSLNIPNEKMEKIKLIAYYGYNYQGHNTDYHYMAAQELIWDEMSDNNLIWVIGLDLSKEVDLSQEKEDIMSLVNTHYTKPSFDNEEIEYTLGEELVLEDTNNVISRYVTNSDNAVIEENKLILNENFDGEEIILTKKEYTDKQILLYTSGDSQKMLSVGTVDNTTSKLKIKLTGGTLEVNKLDKDTGTSSPQGEATLTGALYELYDEEGNLKDTLITGTKNKLEKLPLGKYTLKEKIPSKGYQLDTETYNIEITKENLDIKIDVYEKVINRKVEIFKVFASDTTGELTGESGITFEIYDKNKNIVNTLTTDEEGYTSITLPYGTYTVRQTTTTKNYHTLEDFTITISEYDERPIHKLLSNSEIKTKVKIIKKDLDTKENVINSNIKFKIYDVQNNKYLSFKVSYPENKVTEEFEVDKNGIFITPEPLSSGTYRIYEIDESMNGYLFNKEPIEFTINENSSILEEDGESILEVPFYNKKVTGRINITKYGEEVRYTDNTYYYKKIPLEGVTLNLYAKEDIYQNNKLIYIQDELVKEVTTDIDGQTVITDLPLGKYYIKELKTVGNHILDTTIYDIELKYKDQYTEVIEENIKIENKLLKGKLIINKYETGTSIPIPNTLIEIHTEDNKIIYKGYTDQNGNITIEDLPYGTYHLSETESATGYRLLEDKINFEIKSDEETINIYNERIKVPNTGFTLNIIDVLVIIITIIGFFLIITNPKESKIVFLSILIILLGVTYYIIKVYKYYDDYKNNESSITAYINNEIEEVKEAKYQYSSILEIPSVNIKRGVLDINNTYNDAKYNIELIKEDDTTIVLAAHNGNNQNSYFRNLKNLTLGDEIKYYKDGILYTYLYSGNYDIKKNGYADIYRIEDQKSIILITCKDNTNDAQTVHIGYLKNISTY